jgi:hypothetical protein
VSACAADQRLDQLADIVLLLANDIGRAVRIRCVVRPEPEQAILLQRLGLSLPERLSAPKMFEM